MGDEISDLFNQILIEPDIFKKARLLLELKRDKGVRVIEIAKRLQMKSSYVSHILRLNKLPALVIDGYYNKSITPTHLYIIARLHTTEQITAAYEQILANNLSVFDTEILVRSVLYGISHEGEYLTKDEIRAFTVVMKKKGIEVKIIQSRIRSKLILEVKGNLLKSSVLLREFMMRLQKSGEEEEKKDF